MTAFEHVVECTGCEWSTSTDEAWQANQAAAEHYRERGHLATVERAVASDAGVESVCLTCEHTYHHGGDSQCAKLDDDHREYGGDALARKRGDDVEPHEVAVIDLEHGEVLVAPTAREQAPDRTSYIAVDELRDD